MKENNFIRKTVKLESIDSTNDLAYELAQKGEDEIVLVLADSQSKGKGRLGRSWSSPDGEGIYASFLLRPDNSLQEITLLPLFFALGAAKALSDFVGVNIKWPNDVMVNGKKIAGILAEAKSSQKGADFVIAGIGINVNSKTGRIPSEATSLYLETEKVFDKEGILNRLIKELKTIYENFKDRNISYLFAEAAKYMKEGEKLNLEEKSINDLIVLR